MFLNETNSFLEAEALSKQKQQNNVGRLFTQCSQLLFPPHRCTLAVQLKDALPETQLGLYNNFLGDALTLWANFAKLQCSNVSWCVLQGMDTGFLQDRDAEPVDYMLLME